MMQTKGFLLFTVSSDNASLPQQAFYNSQGRFYTHPVPMSYDMSKL